VAIRCDRTVIYPVITLATEGKKITLYTKCLEGELKNGFNAHKEKFPWSPTIINPHDGYKIDVAI